MELFSFQASSEADLYRPLFAASRAKKMGRNAPPYVPKWDLLPLHKLCRLAQIFKEAEFQEEALAVASWVYQLKDFLSLWCSESEYDEKTILEYISKIDKTGSPSDLAKIPFNLSIVQTSGLKAALTLDGKKTSLGVILAQEIEIRAFGPQSDHLNFGINGKGINGWTQSAAYPDVWLEMKHEIKDEELLLDFRFVGIKPENPLFFALYVKAESCQIGNEVLLPKSLRKFQGETDKINFQNKLFIESISQKVEVIPLAGSGCFWDTEFLIAYPLSAFTPQISLCIKSSCSIAK